MLGVSVSGLPIRNLMISDWTQLVNSTLQRENIALLSVMRSGMVFATAFVLQGREFMSACLSQEFSQKASLTPDWRDENKQPIRSQVSADWLNSWWLGLKNFRSRSSSRPSWASTSSELGLFVFYWQVGQSLFKLFALFSFCTVINLKKELKQNF